MTVTTTTADLSPEERENRAKISQLLKITEAVTVDFVSGVWLDPEDPIEAERRAFTWTINDISEDGFELDLIFDQPLYIS